MAKVREEMFFFDGGRGKRLLGFLHASAGARAGLVYCHPFAEERNQSQGVAVRAARRLAEDGCAVLRFDFSGCGDSEGSLAEADAGDWLAEIDAALSELRARTGLSKVGVWGLRMGANLAARYADGRTDLSLGVFWQPMPDLKLALTQFLRQKLGTQMTVNAATAAATPGPAGTPAAPAPALSVKSLVQQLADGDTVEVMGYPLRQRLYASLLDGDAPFASRRFAFPACLVAFGEDDTAPESMRRIHEALAPTHPGLAFVHAREIPFWDRYWRWEGPAATAETARWVATAA
jgi:exosortase A-associated hydrolase 2